MSTSSADHVVWRLDDLYEESANTRLEKDSEWCRQAARRFAASYSGKVAILGPQDLLQAILEYEALTAKTHKLLSYGYLSFVTQTHNDRASALWQRLQEIQSRIQRDTLFFELEWTDLPEDHIQEILSSPVLSIYHHYLQSLRRYKPHVLSKMEEQLLAEKEPVGSSTWCTLFDKVMAKLRFGVSKKTASEVLSELYHPVRDIRRKAALEFTEGLDSVLHIITHIFNTILLDKSIMDRLRGYPHWLTARNLGNEAEDWMVQTLVQTVLSRYDLVQRYYRLKRRLLDYKQLYDYDRYAPIPGLSDKPFSWEEASEIVVGAYAHFSPQMGEIAQNFFQKNWIHAPVCPGKRSGAFAHPTVPQAHPYIFLNFTGTNRDVMTLAHELGHGIHQYLAREQGFFNSRTPLTLAETASVFGEMLVFESLLARMEDPRERLALRCRKIEDILATVYRQVSMNQFEELIHNERRQMGELAPERFSQLWIQTQSAMFGDSLQLMDHYRTWWSSIPHLLHSPGYVYAYAFGELLVLGVYQQYKERGPAFAAIYLALLKSGGTNRPDVLLGPLGMDLADPLFWHQGLQVLEAFIEEAEAEASSMLTEHPPPC
jgi:oligoendopeptidase F